MTYYLGIDGGGTNTSFSLANGEGEIISDAVLDTTSHKQVGIQGVIDTLDNGIHLLTNKLDIGGEDSLFICFGMPMFGENTRVDKCIESELAKRFTDVNFTIVNDAEVGWAGSLALEAGVNVVAGTGSIAFGKNSSGVAARCGGWSEFFSDEGSAYWLGIKTIELFSKQADSRIRKGALYDIVKKHFSLKNDYDIISIIENDYRHRRDRTASLQMLLYEAAAKGDLSATLFYVEAAKELACMIEGVTRQLGLSAGCKASYSGGLFKSGDILGKPFRTALKNYEIIKPVFSPQIGAILLAVWYGSGADAAYEFKKRMQNQLILKT